MRRLVVPMLVGLLVVSATPAAVADELSDLLESAAHADYAGRQIVVSFLDGETRLEIVDVEHAGSLMMFGSAGNEEVVGSGKLSGGDSRGLALSSWNDSQMSDRYVLGPSQAVKRLSRAATSIEVLEAGVVRMRLVFDDATGTPLVSEVFDGSGRLFRLSSMLEVDSVPSRLYSQPSHQSTEFEVLAPATDHGLPAVAAGYHMADAYSGPDDSVQGFYSDGLFSFSLFVVDGPAQADRFATATVVETDGLKYERLVDPGEIWVKWASGGNTYVLVGDLPPDHLAAVLAELPKPGRRNLFGRLWSGLFG